MARQNTDLMVAFLVFGGLAVIVFGTKRYFDTRKLAAEGKVALATVVDRKIMDLQKGKKSYQLTLAFTTEAQQHIRNKVIVEEPVYNRFAQQDMTKVRYLPSRPSICVIGETVKVEKTFFVAGCVFIAMGLAFFFLSRRSPG